MYQLRSPRDHLVSRVQFTLCNSDWQISKLCTNMENLCITGKLEFIKLSIKLVINKYLTHSILTLYILSHII